MKQIQKRYQNFTTVIKEMHGMSSLVAHHSALKFKGESRWKVLHEILLSWPSDTVYL